ncbi:MAG: GNAT family N-acetyltransferase [Candidatus Omnitrophota bacterium]|nr:GNAT family N-acetyltransferase [Candidatus Omnitrophota bacterium]
MKSDWNALLQESSNDEFFLTWEWVFNWWQVYGKGKELLIISVKDKNGSLLGLAPFYIRKEKLYGFVTVQKIVFLGIGGNVAPEYLNLIIKSGYEEIVIKEVFNYLMSISDKWSVLYFSDILGNHKIADFIIKEANERKLALLKQKIGIPCVYIALPGTWEEMQQRLASKFRYNIKWGRKKLSEISGSQVKLFFNEEIPNKTMEEIFSLHNKRMEEKGFNGKFHLQDYKAFHVQLLKLAPQHKALAVFQINDKPIGMVYGYYYQDKIYFYQSGFDPDSEYKKYSIVQILLSYLIEKSIQLKCKEFDLLRGGEDYKYRWTNLERNKDSIMVFNNRSLKGKFFFYKHALRQIIKKMTGKINV